MIDEVGGRETTGREYNHWATILICTLSNKRVKIQIHTGYMHNGRKVEFYLQPG